MDTIRHLIRQAGALIRSGGIWWGLAISAGLAVGSLIIAVAVVVSWPPHRFAERGPHDDEPQRPLFLRWAIALGKNLLGLVLLLVGAIMALPGVPGQGLLTMIIGITILDFPGKRRLELRLLHKPRVLHALNRLRHRFHRQPLVLD
jgi:H+/Cl- antiporter ClcA